MAMVLHRTLRGLCFKTGWTYAVFWKLKRRNRMVLTWEDGYYEYPKLPVMESSPLLEGSHALLPGGQYPPGEGADHLMGGAAAAEDRIGLAVAKMSYHVYSLGEGIIGRVAFTHKHQWIFGNAEKPGCGDGTTGSRTSSRPILEKYPAGWQHQFSAGVKTIAVVAVPQGVVQLGSTQLIKEDLSLVAHVRALFGALQSVPGAFLSDYVPELQAGQVQGVYPLGMPMHHTSKMSTTSMLQVQAGQVNSLSRVAMGPVGSSPLAMQNSVKMKNGPSALTGISPISSLKQMHMHSQYQNSSSDSSFHTNGTVHVPQQQQASPLLGQSHSWQVAMSGGSHLGTSGFVPTPPHECHPWRNFGPVSGENTSVASSLVELCAMTGINTSVHPTAWACYEGTGLNLAEQNEAKSQGQLQSIAEKLHSEFRELQPNFNRPVRIQQASHMEEKGNFVGQVPVNLPVLRSGESLLFPESLGSMDTAVVNPRDSVLHPWTMVGVPNKRDEERVLPSEKQGLSSLPVSQLSSGHFSPSRGLPPTTPYDLLSMLPEHSDVPKSKGLSLTSSLQYNGPARGFDFPTLDTPDSVRLPPLGVCLDAMGHEEQLVRKWGKPTEVVTADGLLPLTGNTKYPELTFGGDLCGAMVGSPQLGTDDLKAYIASLTLAHCQQQDQTSRLSQFAISDELSMALCPSLKRGTERILENSLARDGTEKFGTSLDGLPAPFDSRLLLDRVRCGSGLRDEMQENSGPNVPSLDEVESKPIQDATLAVAVSVSGITNIPTSSMCYNIDSHCWNQLQPHCKTGHQVNLEVQSTSRLNLDDCDSNPMQLSRLSTEILHRPSALLSLPMQDETRLFDQPQVTHSEGAERMWPRAGQLHQSKILASNCHNEGSMKWFETHSLLKAGVSAQCTDSLKDKDEEGSTTESSGAKMQEEVGKLGRKRARSGENPRPRPKDRQQIQDRVQELREIVPNVTKCSIDALLERTIKHMHFLQSVTQQGHKWKQAGEFKGHDMESNLVTTQNDLESGASWALEVGGQGIGCPIIVENLSQPHQFLVEMLCEENELFLEIADNIRGLGLTILKGIMKARNDKIWARFMVEALKEVHRLDVLWSLTQLLHPDTKMG